MKNSLQILNDSDLESQLEKLTVTERELLHEIILHIQEVDRRKLYLQKAYPSLFSYLCGKFKYSAASAQRRIEAARLADSVPEIAEKIQTGALTLSSIGEIQRAVKTKELATKTKISTAIKKQLIENSMGKSTAQTQAVCAQMLDIPASYVETQKRQQDDSRQLNMTLTANQFEKLQKAKGLLANKILKNGDTSLASTIELLCDLYLSKKIGSRVNEYTQSVSSAEIKICADFPARDKNLYNKTLTPKTRKMIFSRDQTCRWRDQKTGLICSSHFNLQIDHQRPQWAGGDHSPENLRVLCQKHNNWRYQKGI